MILIGIILIWIAIIVVFLYYWQKSRARKPFDIDTSDYYYDKLAKDLERQIGNPYEKDLN